MCVGTFLLDVVYDSTRDESSVRLLTEGRGVWIGRSTDENNQRTHRKVVNIYIDIRLYKRLKYDKQYTFDLWCKYQYMKPKKSIVTFKKRK